MEWDVNERSSHDFSDLMRLVARKSVFGCDTNRSDQPQNLPGGYISYFKIRKVLIFRDVKGTDKPVR